MISLALLVSVSLLVPAVATAKPGCKTRECHKRTAVHQLFPYCNTWRCAQKQLRRQARRLTPLEACIIHHESTGNPLAQNGQYKGIAQWSPYVWARDGGRRFGPTPHHATYAEQVWVLKRGLRRYGCADWCPFDPC